MEHDTKTPQALTSDPTSFAYVSARERWPIILTGAIDDMHRAVSDTAEGEKKEEGKRIVAGIAALKYELQHDRAMTPLPDDGESDVEGYNGELELLGRPGWLDVPWLFAECYLYRRLATFFSLSKHWRSYDVFARQKMSTFRSSRPAVLELAARYKDIMAQLASNPHPSEEASALLFTEMCEICLWGNATDLSLLTSLTYEDIQKLQGSEARKASEKNILVNDLAAAYEVLRRGKADGTEHRQVDIVLDNAGFELYVDLILAGYLLATGLATTVVLHAKPIPWFVSDVVPADLAALLSALHDPRALFDAASEDERRNDVVPAPLSDGAAADLAALFAQWSGFHADGRLRLRADRFWTAAGSYWRLPACAPRLYDDLRASELVVFKGDLNYRKLVGDARWAATTPFVQAIGPLGAGSGVNVLALRTCKADVVVGLEEGRDEELRALEGGGGESGARRWAWSGKWAVVSFSEGRERK